MAGGPWWGDGWRYGRKPLGPGAVAGPDWGLLVRVANSLYPDEPSLLGRLRRLSPYMAELSARIDGENGDPA